MRFTHTGVLCQTDAALKATKTKHQNRLDRIGVTPPTAPRARIDVLIVRLNRARSGRHRPPAPRWPPAANAVGARDGFAPGFLTKAGVTDLKSESTRGFIAPKPTDRRWPVQPARKLAPAWPHPACSFGLGLKSAKCARLPLAARQAALRCGSAPAVAPPALHFSRLPPANRRQSKIKIFHASTTIQEFNRLMFRQPGRSRVPQRDESEPPLYGGDGNVNDTTGRL